MSNSLDPDQARHFVGPDLGPNCLQRLSTDGTNRQILYAFSEAGRKPRLIWVFRWAYMSSCSFSHGLVRPEKCGKLNAVRVWISMTSM